MNNQPIGELIQRIRQNNRQVEEKLEEFRKDMREEFEDYHKKNMQALQIVMKQIKDNTESIKAFQKRRETENGSTGKNS